MFISWIRGTWRTQVALTCEKKLILKLTHILLMTASMVEWLKQRWAYWRIINFIDILGLLPGQKKWLQLRANNLTVWLSLKGTIDCRRKERILISGFRWATTNEKDSFKRSLRLFSLLQFLSWHVYGSRMWTYHFT